MSGPCSCERCLALRALASDVSNVLVSPLRKRTDEYVARFPGRTRIVVSFDFVRSEFSIRVEQAEQSVELRNAAHQKVFELFVNNMKHGQTVGKEVFRGDNN